MTNQKIYKILENNEKYITYCQEIIDNVNEPSTSENCFYSHLGDKKHRVSMELYRSRKIKYFESVIKTVKEINKQYLTKLNKGGNND